MIMETEDTTKSFSNANGEKYESLKFKAIVWFLVGIVLVVIIVILPLIGQMYLIQLKTQYCYY